MNSIATLIGRQHENLTRQYAQQAVAKKIRRNTVAEVTPKPFVLFDGEPDNEHMVSLAMNVGNVLADCAETDMEFPEAPGVVAPKGKPRRNSIAEVERTVKPYVCKGSCTCAGKGTVENVPLERGKLTVITH